MNIINFLFLYLLSLIKAQRRAEGAVLEVNFLLAACLSIGDGFEPVIDLVGINKFVSASNVSNSFNCPSLTRDNITFEAFSNGFTAGGKENFHVLSEFAVDASTFQVEHSYEFWFFIPPGHVFETREILFEVSRRPESQNISLWELDTDYLLRISWDGEVLFCEGAVFGTGISGPLLAENIVGKLSQLTIVAFDVQNYEDFSFSLVTLNKDNIFGRSSTPINSIFESEATLVLGGSLGLSALDSNIFSSTSIDIHKFSIYPFGLGGDDINIFNNFFGVEDSPPSIASLMIDHLEDDITSFTFESFLLDFDNEFVTGGVDDYRVMILSLPGRGRLLDNVGVGDVIAENRVLRYVQSNANEGNGIDTFSAAAVELDESSNVIFQSLPALITLQFQQTNDPPRANTRFVSPIVGGTTTQVLFRAIDVDSEGGVEEFLPNKFIVEDIVGTFFEDNPVVSFFHCRNETEIIVGNSFEAKKTMELILSQAYVLRPLSLRLDFHLRQLGIES